MIKDTKTFLDRVFATFSDDTKLLVFDFARRCKLSIMTAMFKVVKDVNKNTYELVDKVITDKSDKLIPKDLDSDTNF